MKPANQRHSERPQQGIAIIGTMARGGIRSVIENHLSAGIYDGYTTYLLASHHEGGLLKRGAAFLATLGRLLWLLITHKVVLCHLHGSMKGSILRKALLITLCRTFGCATVFHLHGSEFAKTYDNANGAYRWAVRYVLNHSQQIFVLSNYWHHYVSGISRNPNITIANNFPDPRCFALADNKPYVHDQPKQFLFLGYIGARKGIYDLVEAVSTLNQSGHNDFVLQVGGNGDAKGLRQFVREKRVDHLIEVIGWVTGADKDALLQGADVFILPSYNEGLPIAILEAMAAGVPIISTPVGGIPEAIKSDQYGLLVSPGNIHQIAHAMKLFMQSANARKTAATNARIIYTEHYSAGANRNRIRQALAHAINDTHMKATP